MTVNTAWTSGGQVKLNKSSINAPQPCSCTQPRPSCTSRMQSQHSTESTAQCTQCRGQATRRGWHGTPAKHVAIQCLSLVTYIAAWDFAQITSLNAAFKFPPSVSSTSDPPFLSVSCFQYTSGRTKHTASSPLAISPEPKRLNPTMLLHSLQRTPSFKDSSPFQMLSL